MENKARQRGCSVTLTRLRVMGYYKIEYIIIPKAEYRKPNVGRCETTVWDQEKVSKVRLYRELVFASKILRKKWMR